MTQLKTKRLFLKFIHRSSDFLHLLFFINKSDRRRALIFVFVQASPLTPVTHQTHRATR